MISIALAFTLVRRAPSSKAQDVATRSGCFFYVATTSRSENGGPVWVSAGSAAQSHELHGCDIFEQSPGQAPVELTDHRTSKLLGGGIYGLSPSPSRKYVAFLANEKGETLGSGWAKRTLFLLDVANRSVRKLAPPDSCHYYSWSPSGDTLAFELDNGKSSRLKTMSLAAGASSTRELPSNLVEWSWRGNGRIVLETKGESGLRLSVLGAPGHSGPCKVGKGSLVMRPVLLRDGSEREATPAVAGISRTVSSQVMFKRSNSIAQNLAFPEYDDQGKFLRCAGTGPVPDGIQGAVPPYGVVLPGMYVDEAKFLNGAWGSDADIVGSFLGFDATLESQFDLASPYIDNEGSYPGGAYVNWNSLGDFFDELNINVQTNPT